MSGHLLLERYGMTEVGMALTNPLRPESARRPGRVGRPFPGVEARIVETVDDGEARVLAAADSDGLRIDGDGATVSGDLQIRGDGVFRGYHGREEATRREFVDGGDGDGARWFKTGDVAEVEEEDGWSFKILGRRSVDIIK